MAYTYTPTYYTSLHDTINSLCKTILPFSSFKKRLLPVIAATDQHVSKQQSDNLKWQQDSFHQMLNLMGLCKEGIVPENEVSTFRTHLLETLITSPVSPEQPPILRDKLVFLQELLYARCISEEEYHASKRPLLQRLAVQGAEIEVKDVTIGGQKETPNEEWSDIDLKDEKCLANQEISTSKNKYRERSALKKMKGAVSVFGFLSPAKNGTSKDNGTNNEGNRILRAIDHNVSTHLNAHLNERKSDSKSIFIMENLPSAYVKAEEQTRSDKRKEKPSWIIFQRQQEGCGGGENDGGPDPGGKEKAKMGKKAWLIDGLKKWRKNDSLDETASLTPDVNLDGTSYAGKLVANPVAEGPDTKQIKRKLHPNGAPTDFFVDKVLGDNIKKELSRIQREHDAKNPNVHLTDDQIEAISTRLPVDKEDLKSNFSKSWCDLYGDIVLDVVRKQFKDHMKDMGSCRGKARGRQTKFDKDENSRPNLFAPVAFHTA